jgi:hypothetical protein
MSLYDYQRSIHIAAQDEPFDALIMAAMLKADPDNLLRLQAVFPYICIEFQRRYGMGGGILPEERGMIHDGRLVVSG